MHKLLLLIIIVVITCVASVILQFSSKSLLISSNSSSDYIAIEYIKHELIYDQSSVISSQSEILTIDNDSSVHYKNVIENNILDKESKLHQGELQKLISIIKNTGFLSMARDYLQSNIGHANFTKHILNISLNSKQYKISWNTNDEITSPPIIHAVELELNDIINQLIK